MELRDALFAALRYELTDTLPEGVSFDACDDTFLKALYEFSGRQEVAHLVGDALEKLGVLSKASDEIAECFRRRQAVSAYHAEQQRQVFEMISAAFDAKKIPYLPLKGLVIRPLYPEPWMRTAGDLDILVKQEDLERAEACLAGLGAKKVKTTEHDLEFLFFNGVTLELHFKLLEDGYANDAERRLFQNVWADLTPKSENSFCCALSPELFYCYHLAHAAKHLEMGTCGIRPFLDAWVLLHRWTFDEGREKTYLSICGLLLFAESAEKLIRVWFSDAPKDDWTSALEGLLLSGGVFGSAGAKQSMAEYEKRGRLRYFFSRIFLSFDEMKREESILEKHPILFPFLQVKRWFRILFGGRLRSRRHARKEAEKIDMGEHTIAELREHLGLLRKENFI